MPNTPMLVGEGMVAVAAGAHATADDIATARRLFEAAADVIEVEEEKMDAVTANAHTSIAPTTSIAKMKQSTTARIASHARI